MSYKYEIVKLSDICDISSCKRIFAKEYQDSGIPFYRGKEIIELHNNKKVSNDLYISEDRYEEIKNKFGVPEKGDILLTSVGTLGVPYHIEDNNKFYFKDGNLTWFRNFKNVNSKFIYYWLCSSSAKNQIYEKSIGSTQKAITINMLNNFQLYLPPIEVQNKIVNIIASFDKKIELNTRINKHLDNLIDCIFKCFVDNEKIVGYEKIGDLTQCLLGGTPSRKKAEYWGGEIPWINSGEVNNFRIIEPSEYISKKGLNSSSTKLLPNKTIVLAITGATLGQFSLLEIDCCANQSVVGILDNDNLHYQFLYPYVKFHINDLISGQTGGAQQHINNNDIKNFKVPVYDDTVMDLYLKKVTTMFDLISNNCFENNRLKKLRDAFLPKLMSGEIDL